MEEEKIYYDSKVFVCPKCDGEKVDLACPSPSIDNATYYPPCTLCEGRGFVVYNSTKADI